MKTKSLLAFLLILCSGLAFSTSFTIPASQVSYKASTLTGVDSISPQQLWADITPSGTWHYYSFKDTGDAVKSAPTITAVGFTRKDSSIIKGTFKTADVTTYFNTMTCESQKEICAEECTSEIDENGTMTEKCADVCSPQPDICTTKEESTTTSMTTFTEDSKGKDKLLAVKTNNWEKGSFNPDVSACGALNTSNTVYTMNQSAEINGSTCFTVTAANVTLDCAGFSVTGNNTLNAMGVYSVHNNTTVKNCVLSTWHRPILFTNSTNSLMLNNTVTNGAAGSQLYTIGGSNNRIIGNSVTNTEYGIAPTGNYDIIANNTVTITTGSVADARAIYLFNNTLAQNNTVSITSSGASASHGYHVDGANATIDCQGATTTGTNKSLSYGVYSDQFNTTIKNCNISNFQHGIYFDGADNGTIDNTNASTTKTGGIAIYIYTGANYNTISNSIGNSAKYTGIRIENSNSNNIINSTGTSSIDAGILLFNGAYYNTITNSNGTSNSSYGIDFLTNANSNNILNSIGTSNSTIGIYLSAASSNTITNSTGVSNTYRGIQISSASNNNQLAGTVGNSSSSHAIYIDGGSNALIDCQGKSITGTNTSSTYGIYSNQFNTTVKNCNISNFQHGIYFVGPGGTNGTIQNTNAITTYASGHGIYLLYQTKYFSIINSTGTSTSGNGIRLENTASYNTLINSTGTSGSGYAIYFAGNANYNTLTNFTGTSNSNKGFYIETSSNNIINNSFARNLASGAAGYGLYVASGSNNNQIINTTASSAAASAIYIDGGANVSIDCQGRSIAGTNTTGTYGIYSNQFNTTVKNCNVSNFANAINLAGATSALIQNNTFIPDAGATRTLVVLNGSASSNTFCLNNFTATTGAYVSDLNGSNNYNCTYASKNQGNVYANVINNSVPVWGTTASSIAGLYIGTNINYTNTTSLGKFSCNFANCADFAPLTYLNSVPYPSNFSIYSPISWLLTYYTPNSTLDINWTNSTSPIGRTINYTVYLYLFNGTLNGTLNDTLLNYTTFNSTGYDELRYHARIGACDDGLDLCTYNDSADFGIYTPSLSANFSIFASNDGAIVPHDWFVEYCAFTCYPDFTCNSAGANLTQVGGVPYMTVITTNYTGSNVPINFTNLASSVYKRQIFIGNLYGNTSVTTTREVTIEGEPVQPITNIPQQVPQYLFLAIVWLLAGYLIYNSFKKTSANSKKETSGSDNHV